MSFPTVLDLNSFVNGDEVYILVGTLLSYQISFSAFPSLSLSLHFSAE